MGCAKDFEHYIPPEDWDGGGHRYKSNPKRNQYSPYSYYTRSTVMVNKPVEELIHSTDKAYLFQFKEGKCWFPIREVTYSKHSKKITIPEWLWRNRKFIQ